MLVGIVGSEAAKFTEQGRLEARRIILELLDRLGVTGVVSGGCHLGGIDIWAVEIGRTKHLKTVEYLPAQHSWPYYKERNMQIVSASNEVHCITVDVLPPNFKGMRFDLCYHCKTKDHVKSGGCWTMKQAITQGMKGELHIVKNL
jgi:hypothetical protein